MPWAELDMRVACDEVRTGGKLKRVVKKYGILSNTPQGRLDGHCQKHVHTRFSGIYGVAIDVIVLLV
jgi:hypothetical protein